LKERRIRVNTVSPGPIDTPLLRSLPNYETRAVELKAATTMNRIGTPDELAKVVVFLASDDSSYITGIELFVDGGLAQI
jgi:NAD(P)-dependent dehydrogenase (short-subunit alcohol dehydrogenase family)